MTALAAMLLALLADPADGLAKAMLPIYVKEAEAYTMAVETAPKQSLEFVKEPILEWSDSARDGLFTQGVVFLWLRAGRPAAIGTIYSEPEKGRLKGRTLLHEFHALDPEKLVVTRPKGSPNEWVPRVGLARREVPDAPAPAGTAAARTVQLKALAAEFAAHGVDPQR